MQTEKSQLSGQWIMPETGQISFPALSIDPRVGISLSASETALDSVCLVANSRMKDVCISFLMSMMAAA